ncbi:MAG: response regulator transcription factor [Polyangiaceae bacterium]
MSDQMPPMPVRVFLVDDHEIVRGGLRALIAAQADMIVVGEAAEGLSFLNGVDAARPDVVVMDVSMPVLDGIETTRRLKATLPEVKVITLSAREERSYIELIMAAGASGYVLKRSAADDLVRAIRAIVAGGVYLDPSMAASALAPLRQAGSSGAPTRLSERESEVLRMIAEGHAVKDVATRLGISTRTLETYRSRAMDKLGLKTRADIVRHALQRGWLRSE